MVKHRMLPMADANVGEVLGLVEIIYAYGCKAKISFLADELRIQLDHLGPVLEMAEALHLVKIKNGEAELTLYGEALNLGTIDNKKEVLRKQLTKLDPFKTVLSILKKTGPTTRKELIEKLRRAHGMIIEDEQRFHKLLLGWGGYAEVVEYNGVKQTFELAHIENKSK